MISVIIEKEALFILNFDPSSWCLRVGRGRGTFMLFNALLFYFSLAQNRCDYDDYTQDYVYLVLQATYNLFGPRT